MLIIAAILHSNLVQLFLTFFCGILLYVLFHFYKSIFNFIGYLLSFGILLSFLFNIGEVYPYSYFYKRAFFFFGDQITTIIVLFFCYSVLRNDRYLSIFTALAIFLSGGKASIIFLFIIILLLIFANHRHNEKSTYHFGSYLLIGFCLYFVCLFTSHTLEHMSSSNAIRDFIQSKVYSSLNVDTQEQNAKNEILKNRLSFGTGACATLSKCIDTQIVKPALERYYSTLGGLWMTIQGGYSGKHYPNSPSKFANLMLKKNPWKINDRYGLNFIDWRRIGAPQNPYLRFGSAYGPLLLCVLIICLLFMAFIGIKIIVTNENEPTLVFTVFYVVMVIFNQTQSWLTSGSLLLIFIGFCFFHIFLKWISIKNYIPQKFL